MNETLKTESPKEDENDVNDTSLNESSFVLSSALSNLEDNDTQKIPNTPINFNHNKKKALIPKEVNSVKKIEKSSSKKDKENKLPSLINSLTEKEYNSVPSYLTTQLSIQNINKSIEELSDFVLKKRNTNSTQDHFSEEEIKESLSFGNKTRTILLILMKLKRISSIFVDGKNCFKV